MLRAPCRKTFGAAAEEDVPCDGENIPAVAWPDRLGVVQDKCLFGVAQHNIQVLDVALRAISLGASQ